MNASALTAGQILREVVRTSIDAVRPVNLFRQNFVVAGEKLEAFGSSFNLASSRRIRCVAVGKCAEAMVLEVAKVLGNRVSGMIATPIPNERKVEGFTFYLTGHPLPNEKSLEAARSIRGFLESSAADDLVIFLISGGGSSAIFLPAEGISLSDANTTVRVLFEHAVPITKVNLVRRHISALGGGKLAELVPRQEKLSLIISDVVGDNPRSIASGPTVEDDSNATDALDFILESGLDSQLPAAVLQSLKNQPSSFRIRRIEKNKVVIIGTNRDALSAAEKSTREIGVNVKIVSRYVDLEADVAGEMLVSYARSIVEEKEPIAPPALLLFGGETTVSAISGHKGGGINIWSYVRLRDCVNFRKPAGNSNG